MLGTERTPCMPSDVAHTYDDKYLLAEIGTRSTILATRNTLDHLTNAAFTANLPQMMEWARNGQTISLITEAEETCTFIKTTTRDVKSNTTQVTKTSGVFGNKKEQYTVTKVTEHEWNFTINWEIYVYAGDDLETTKISLCNSTCHTVLTTRGDKAVTPKPEQRNVLKTKPNDISWLLKALGSNLVNKDDDDDKSVGDKNKKENETKTNASDTNASNDQVVFTIDRNDEKHCHTPSKNKQIEDILSNFNRFTTNWSRKTSNYISRLDNNVSGEQQNKRAVTQQLTSVGPSGLFDPIPATFSLEEQEDGKGTVLTLNDLDLILKKMNTSFDRSYSETMVVVNGNKTSMHDSSSVQVVLGCALLEKISRSHRSMVIEIENMLTQQLISAIGKIIQPRYVR